MNEGNIGFYQNVEVITLDIFGNEIRREKVHNLIPSTGLDLFRDHLLSTMTALTPHHFVLGSGSTPAASTDVTLQSSNYNISFTGSTVRPAGVTFNGSIYSTDGVGSTWKELGIFTSSSQMIGRAIIATIIKTSSAPTNELIAWGFDLTAST